MAISLVTHVGANGSATGVTTAGVNTTGATTIFLAVAALSTASAAVAVSDSKSNKYYLLSTQAIAGSNGQIQIYFCNNPTVGSGHTFTVSGTSIFASICAAVFSGGFSAYEKISGATATSVQTIQPGSITPSANGELLITALGEGTGATGSTSNSIDSSFTITDQIHYSTGSYFGASLAYLVQATAAAVNPTWTTNDATDNLQAIMVTNIVTSGGSGGGGGLLRTSSLDGIH